MIDWNEQREAKRCQSTGFNNSNGDEMKHAESERATEEEKKRGEKRRQEGPG